MPKYRKVRPGLGINFAYQEVLQKAERTPKIYDKDSQNRRYVVDKVLEFMKCGKSLDEAVDLIMQDDIMKEFDYWTKNNLDVKQCIVNLVRTYPKNRQTKGKER